VNFLQHNSRCRVEGTSPSSETTSEIRRVVLRCSIDVWYNRIIFFKIKMIPLVQQSQLGNESADQSRKRVLKTRRLMCMSCMVRMT
jgi:hypothetical protein